jgi:hypothetical protein
VLDDSETREALYAVQKKLLTMRADPLEPKIIVDLSSRDDRWTF